MRMELAAALQHSAYKGAGPEANDALRSQKTVNSKGDAVFYELYDEDTAGSRPPCLGEPPGPQARVQRHTVEQMIESFVPVPILDLDGPVPQMVEQLVGVLNVFDKSLPEQVIEVPKITLQDGVPHRAALRKPQLAEQLVEVPTHPGYALAVVAVQTFGWRAARALLEQLNTARPGRDTNTGHRDGG